ncbi:MULTISPECIES: alpha/beta fold hydrolase [unclassified Polaribacter]|uniref:alpha/beta fold hydrolase n=1 Tax=unclassified Polaribacter TaxID=196858 RepID=UPI00052D42E0|nr:MULTISPECIES: alpha/beta hydrolase [unclassified Polaribacter]KGL61067.1 alpha/beta hydrolase [Polaribacter sp. Hel1_33_49]PKV64648.1 pimeloyl-ACP methyl ester carboxylesterase [Polaribacter sp. Hel1_33_96]
MNSLNWQNKGEIISVNNRNIFVIDTININLNTIENQKKTLVILHGYPTSSFDYYKVLPELSKHYRVVIHDHLGFGFSDKPLKYSYSLIEQADIALQLWKQLSLTNVTLLAHDYGTSIATEILARQNKKQINLQIDELILCNGSMHIELSKLRTIQKLLKNKITGKWVAKLTNYTIFKKNMRNVYFDKTKATEAELKEMWLQLEQNNGRKIIHFLSNYINERYYFWHRWIGALKETNIKTKIIWAKNDPVAVAVIADLLATEIANNNLYWIKNCGHFPMLEKPEEWIEKILSD